MKTFACFGKKLQRVYSCFRVPIPCSYKFLLFHVSPVLIQLCYFISISCVGFLVLKVLNPRSTVSYRPKNLDVFFMSVSATTVSSMGTIEMEVFSNAQLVVLTLLMLLGGEVFAFMLGLRFTIAKFKKQDTIENKIDPTDVELTSVNSTEVGEIQTGVGLPIRNDAGSEKFGSEGLRYRCLRYLNSVVLGFLLVVLVAGSSSILVYLSLVSSAREVLKKKHIQMQIFAVFTTVSTFTNCGFIPTNENMIIFQKNSGLLLLLIPQVLFGNTLFLPCLRLVMWLLRRLTKRVEFDYILKNPGEFGYDHLLPGVQCLFLTCTVFGFIVVQSILFCSLEWHADALSGLSSYQKIVGALFQSVNSRHAGESMVDISTLSSAILVLYVVMMYLPRYTSFLATEEDGEASSWENGQRGSEIRGWAKSLQLSQLSYLVICIVLICIIEREKIAYGNVGFSTGYSCQRQLKPDSSCKDAWTGFVGRWSSQGKLILIFVMLFGRLKKFGFKEGELGSFFKQRYMIPHSPIMCMAPRLLY
ncbi:putative cation transporter HKT7 [Cinnamomum micranthum f. kanehirae]|uniref:Putative cation transporter HKT7 n=1 Tax=Cinnamomum micranthum f. kanehirae TaxID=337451 RepID=A0A3S3M8P8_9MAGN|nr:putative cation transporter HKT7 [Cinnamomum micranthum f. kanehirae]